MSVTDNAQSSPTSLGKTIRDIDARRVKRRWLDTILFFAILIIGTTWFMSGVETQDYHLDESRWINRAHYLRDLADPFGATWNHQYLSRGQPPVGSYSIGLGLLLQGRDLDTNPAYDFRRSREWNIDHGTLPDHDDLIAARRWNAFLGGASAAVLYLAVRYLSNPVGGVVAAILLLSNPLEIWYNRIALADSTLTLNLAVLYLATVVFMRRPRWSLALGIGVLIGLAGANKFTPLALAAPFAAIGGVLLLQAWWRRVRFPQLRTMFAKLPSFSHAAWMMISTPFVALATFVVVYPYLWPDPINRISYMLAFRRMEMRNQYDLNPRFRTDSPGETIEMMFDLLGNHWSSTLQLFRWFGNESLGMQLGRADFLFACIGLIALIIVGVVKGLRSAELMIAALILVQFGAIVLNMQVAFERYYLPIMVGEFLAAGVAVGYLTSGLRALVTRTRRSGAAP